MNYFQCFVLNAFKTLNNFSSYFLQVKEMIEIEIKGLQPSPQKFLLEKSGINLLEVNKFLKFCKTRVNSPTKNNKTPLNFLKIVEKPINFSNFSDPLFVPFQPTSTSENLSTKTLCNSSTSPFILPKKTQSLGIKQFSNPSSSTFFKLY